jgi:phosphoheptose isomerase
MCEWGQHYCATDADCLGVYRTSQKYKNENSCDNVDLNTPPNPDDFNWCACKEARDRSPVTPAPIPDISPFCTSSCTHATFSSTDYFCVGVESNIINCYGNAGNCQWGQSSCTTDADCIGMQSGAKFTDSTTCASIDLNFAPDSTTDYKWCACDIAKARYVTPPTSQPSTQPSSTPSSSYLASILSSPTYRVRNGFAFAAYTPSGAMQAWGDGKDMKIAPAVVSGVESVAANRASYVALLSDGTVEAYGTAAYMRGYETYQSGTALVSLVANDGAYAGVDTTGAAIAFGGPSNGNSVAASGFATQLASGVKAVVASAGSFTALMLDGTVFTWGSKYCGGGVSSLTRTDLVGIVKVVATKTAFAGLTAAGKVLTWGDAHSGGDSSAVAAQLHSSVFHITSSQSAFIAFKRDTSIVVWGNPWYGADTSAVAAQLTDDIVYVAYTSAAFAALKSDGSVVVWGNDDSGGDATAVQSALHNVAFIVGNHYAFAALKTDGSVVAWGDAAEGGSIPSALTTSLSASVTELFATRRAFAALKGATTGELVLWGNPYHGGDAGAAAVYLTSGVRTVCSNDAAFTAILLDGRAAAWGHASAVPAPGLLLNKLGNVYTAFTANSKCV